MLNSTKMKKKVKRLDNKQKIYIEDLYIRYKSQLYTAVATILRTVDISSIAREIEIEDCISETFCRVCERIDVLQHHENPAGWLMITAKNVAREHRRNILHHQDDSLSELIWCIMSDINLERDVSSKLDAQKILQFIAIRSQREQILFILYYIEENNMREIALRLKTSEAAAKQALYRLRTKIKKFLPDR